MVMPNEIAFQVRRDQLFITNAIFKALGRGVSTLDDIINQPLTPELNEFWKEQIDEHELLTPMEARRLRLPLGTQYIEQMANVNVGMQRSIKGLLQLVIVNAWTCFECFVEDLLKTSIQEHVASFPHISPDKKWRFRSRDQIRDSYKQAFKPDGDNIKAAIFSDSITALALLRNILVHKAGIVDKDFTTGVQASPALTPFVGLSEGEEVKLDGEIVRSLFDPLINTCCDLLVAVDNWLQVH